MVLGCAAFLGSKADPGGSRFFASIIGGLAGVVILHLAALAGSFWREVLVAHYHELKELDESDREAHEESVRREYRRLIRAEGGDVDA